MNQLLIFLACSPCACGIQSACPTYGLEFKYLIAGIALAVAVAIGITHFILRRRNPKKLKALKWPLFAALIISVTTAGILAYNIAQAHRAEREFQERALYCNTHGLDTNGSSCEY